MSSETSFFHIFTVKPVEVESHELPRVQYGDYYLFATSLQAAWDTIKEWDGLASSQAAWGIRLDQSFKLTPDSIHHQQQLYSKYRHWAQTQDRYTLIHSSTVALTQAGLTLKSSAMFAGEK